MDMDTLTFAIILTAGGATASAALITGLIAMLKKLSGVNQIVIGREPTVAFFFSAILVVVAFYALGVYTPASALNAFLAWYGIAQISMGVHDTVKSVTSSSQP